MRLLHAADLHLDSPLRSVALRDPGLAERLRTASRTVLTRIADLAIEHRADALVLAGDTFDNAVPDVVARTILARELGRLGEAGIPTIMIRGNHDGLLDPARYGPMGDDVIMLDHDRPSATVGEATFHGLSHRGREEPESMLPHYPGRAAGRINIGLMHCSPDGATGHDPYAPCSIADLLGHGYDYWALGHIHKRQVWQGERGLAVMPGIPQGRHVREAGGGSVTLVDIDADGPRLRELPVALVAFREIELRLSEDESAGDRARRLTRELAETRQEGQQTVLRVRLTGTGARPYLGRPDEARDFLATLAQGTEALFLDRVEAEPGTAAPPQALLGDLAAAMRAEAAKPGFRTEAEAMVRELRDALPVAARDALSPEDLDPLIARGLEAVTARLISDHAE